MKASDNIPACSVCIRAMGEYVFDALPSCRDLFEALISLPEYKSSRFSLSDCFAKGFVYKPLSLDTPVLSSKEEYRLFKVAKKASFIEKDLLESLSSPEDLTELLQSRAVKVSDSHLYSTLNGFSSPFSKSIEAADKSPVKVRIKRDALLEFYVSSDSPLSILEGKELKICNFSFSVESVTEIQKCHGTQALLLAPMKTEASSAVLPLKAFRLGYSTESKTQFFLPGSVFSEQIQSFPEDRLSPFLIGCNV